jgi:hypothetical protein
VVTSRGLLPTVLLLLSAARFGWHDDRKNPDGSVTVGYTTILLNINVVLLFFWSDCCSLGRPFTAADDAAGSGGVWVAPAHHPNRAGPRLSP